MFFLHLERDGEFTGQSPFLHPVKGLVLTPLNTRGGGTESQPKRWSVSWEL